MGCIVVRSEFLKNHKSEVDSFLSEYEASIEYISNPENLDNAAEMIVAGGILPKLAIAKKALANLSDSISFIKGEKMTEALLGFYNAIKFAPPVGDFYYE